MTKLSPNWITEGIIDFEHKKYILLAYLQQVNSNFNENRLYPFLAELIFHYRNLISLKENKEMISQNFPKKLTKLDLEKFKLEYERMMNDDDHLQEIQSIIDYALPKMKVQIEDGREIYDFVEEKLEIYPVGIVPLQKDLGYMMMKQDNTTETQVYQYEVTIFEGKDEKYRGLKTEYITSYHNSISTTFENMKIDLIRKNKMLPNPATFLVLSRLSFPITETLLPVAKRSFVRYIAGIS